MFGAERQNVTNIFELFGPKAEKGKKATPQWTREEKRKPGERGGQRPPPPASLGGLGSQDVHNSLAAEADALGHVPQRHQPPGTGRLKHP